MNKVLALLAVLLTFGVSALAETPKETYDRWMQAVSPEYGYQIAYELSTNPAYVNSERLGGRQAGSDAEHAAAEYLYQEMLLSVLKMWKRWRRTATDGSSTARVSRWTARIIRCIPTPRRPRLRTA